MASEGYRVQKLSTKSGLIVRSSSTVQALHNAVEELIYNSVDAASNSIELFVDFKDCSFKIVDCGEGISTHDMQNVGEWNYTSKNTSCGYGQKGEAVAAIVQLSKGVQICSRHLSSTFATVKTFEQNENNDIEITSTFKSCGDFYGTVVTVDQLFHSFPVRLKAMRPEVEMAYIKELVRHISMLHHHISWLVVDVTGGDSFSEKVVCRYAAQSSVPKRFLSVHGTELYSCMTEVPEQSNGVFTLQGLMSAPLSTHCHWTKRYQYCYLNSRWLRGSDQVSVLVNQLFAKALAGAHTAGTLPKHYPSGISVAATDSSGTNLSLTSQQQQQQQRIAKYPLFVLQVACNPAEYDILSEPDKTSAMFRQPHLLVDLVVAVVRSHFERHNSELLPALEAAIKANSLCANVRERETNSPETASQNDTLFSPSDLSNNSPQQAQLSDSLPLYSIASTAKSATESHASKHMDLFSQLRYDESSADSRHSQLFQTAFCHDDAKTSHQAAEFVTPVVDRGALHVMQDRQMRVKSRVRKRKLGTARSAADQSFDHAFDESIFRSDGVSFLGQSEVGATVSRATTSATHFERQFDQQLSSQEYATDDSSHCQFSGSEFNLSAASSEQCSMADPFRAFALSPAVDGVYTPQEIWCDGAQWASGDVPEEQLYGDPVRLEGEFWPAQLISESVENSQEVQHNFHPPSFDSNTDFNAESNFVLTFGRENSANDSLYPPVEQELDPLTQHDAAWHPTFVGDAYLDERAADTDWQAQPVVGTPSIDSEPNSDPSEDLFPAPVVSIASTVSSAQLATHVQHSLRAPPLLESSQSALESEPQGSPLPHLMAPQQRHQSTMSDDFRASGSTGLEREVNRSVASARSACINIDRAMLRSCRLVGQCDLRYIITTVDAQTADGSTGRLLVAFDQHAADERVNLERLAGDELAVRDRSFVAVDETAVICDDVKCILEQRTDLFHSWHFEYHIAPSVVSGGSRDDNVVQYTLTVVQTPTVLDEPLSVHDLLEFVQYVSEGRVHFPVALLRPPAVQRILASRACHSSIRFGDRLDSAACTQLLGKLAETELPFQCAHGRPSVAPLMDVSALSTAFHARREREIGEETTELISFLRSLPHVTPT